jgi:hypothetical protein
MNTEIHSLIACLAISLAIMIWPAHAAEARARLLHNPVHFVALSLSIGVTLWLIWLTSNRIGVGWRA